MTIRLGLLGFLQHKYKIHNYWGETSKQGPWAMSIVYSKKRKRIQPINDLWEEPLQIKIWPITLTFSHSSSHSETKKIVKESPLYFQKWYCWFCLFWLIICLAVFMKNFSKLGQSTVSIILISFVYVRTKLIPAE